jgi:hypothetical protein
MFRVRIAAILLVCVGYGWAGGHFIPRDSPKVAYIFQSIIVIILLIFGVHFFSSQIAGARQKNWPIRGFNIFFSLSLVINVLNILHGVYSAGNSFGSHNSFADLVPIGLIILSAFVWFSAFFLGKGEFQK